MKAEMRDSTLSRSDERRDELCHRIQNLRRKHGLALHEENSKVDFALNRILNEFSPRRSFNSCRVLLLFVTIMAIAGVVVYQHRVLVKYVLAVRSYAYFFRPLRLVSLVFLRRWPWLSSLYRAECIVDNPYYQGEVIGEDGELRVANCACKRVTSVQVATLEEVFLRPSINAGSQPCLVNGMWSTLGSHGWTSREFLSWAGENMRTLEEGNCGLVAFGQKSVIEYGMSVSDLVKKAEGSERSSSYMGGAWLLCHKSNAKHLIETILPIPELPAALAVGLEPSTRPSLLLHIRLKDFLAKQTAPLDGMMPPPDSLAVQVQMVGVETVRLLPTNCNMCTPLVFEVSAGQTLLYNTSVWTADLLVTGKKGISLQYSSSFLWPDDAAEENELEN